MLWTPKNWGTAFGLKILKALSTTLHAHLNWELTNVNPQNQLWVNTDPSLTQTPSLAKLHNYIIPSTYTKKVNEKQIITKQIECLLTDYIILRSIQHYIKLTIQILNYYSEIKISWNKKIQAVVVVKLKKRKSYKRKNYYLFT